MIFKVQSKFLLNKKFLAQFCQDYETCIVAFHFIERLTNQD